MVPEDWGKVPATGTTPGSPTSLVGTVPAASQGSPTNTNVAVPPTSPPDPAPGSPASKEGSGTDLLGNKTVPGRNLRQTSLWVAWKRAGLKTQPQLVDVRQEITPHKTEDNHIFAEDNLTKGRVLETLRNSGCSRDLCLAWENFIRGTPRLAYEDKMTTTAEPSSEENTTHTERCSVESSHCVRHRTPARSRLIRQRVCVKDKLGGVKYKYRSVKTWICSETGFWMTPSNAPDSTQGENQNIFSTKTVGGGSRKRTRD